MSDYRASSVAVTNGPALAPGCDAPVITPAPLPEAIFVDLPSRIRATAAARLDATALIHETGQLDQPGLARAMDAVAGVLADRGIGPGHIVASVAANYADHLALYLEAALQSHRDVAEAAVVAPPSLDRGETPMAFSVPRTGTDTGADADPEKPRLWANARRGKPQRITAISLCDSLPRSDIGKVLKRDLCAPCWGHRP